MESSIENPLEDHNQIENPEEEINEEEKNELLNEKLENIMKKIEELNVDKEIGEKEKQRETRIIIDKIELENFKSYAGLKEIGPLHTVSLDFLNF